MNPFKRFAKLNLLITALLFVACSPQRKVQQYSYLLKHKPKSYAKEIETVQSKNFVASNQVLASVEKPKLERPKIEKSKASKSETVVRKPVFAPKETPAPVVAPLSKTEIKASILVPAHETEMLDFEEEAFEPKIFRETEKKQLLKTADKFIGTPYLYAGNSKVGIDCSGLICEAYASIGIFLPRSSSAMAKNGISVPLNRVEAGNLLFFHSYKGKGINHVGMVSKVEGDEVEFIHSTVSNGVRKDKLSDPYWSQRFRKAIVPSGKK